jgi:Zn-dependent protease
MWSFLSNIGPEIPLSLLLMGVLGLRAKVRPTASIFIRTTPDVVFDLVDMVHGKIENWGRTKAATEQIEGRNLYRKTYTTTLTTGAERSHSALFSLRHHQKPQQLEIAREGLEGRSLNNELLSQTYAITPEAGGTRLSMAYEWGPRPLLAQLVARADLLGGAYRLKAMAETGKPSDSAYQLISAAVSILTGAISFVAFALMMGWMAAGLLIVALFVHELGHLLAYRLMGQPWGRMIFLPFLGAVAMPRLAFESQAQSVFAALMGPGFSILLAFACAWPVVQGADINPMLAMLGLITTALNVFNLIPVEPLDGGVALRSVLARFMGSYARFGLMAAGMALAAVGIYFGQVLLLLFGGIAILFNIKERRIDAGLIPLNHLQVLVAFTGYICMITVYVALMLHYFALVMQLRAMG